MNPGPALLIACALLPQAALGAGEVLTTEDMAWASVSQNAAIELRQTATAPNACHLACTSDGGQKELWSADVCLANKNQLRFISNDGEKVIVLEPLPSKAGSSWKGAGVAFLYHRTELEKTAVASAMVRDITKVREGAKHFNWLGGVLGIPGNIPKYKEDGSGVEVEAIDGRPKTIRFDGSEFPVPPPISSGKKKPKHG